MKRIVFILILFSVCSLIDGQASVTAMKSGSDCTSSLKEADRLYQDGLYEKCKNVLEEVLKKCNLPKSEKLHALELLAKTYVETDETDKAESTVDILLHNFPNYELKEQENSESYNRLVKKFDVHPELSLGIRNTADWINFTTIKIYTVSNGVDYNASYSGKREGILTGFGLMYYGWAEFQFNRNLSVNGDLIFKWTSFSRDLSKPSTFDINFSETDNYVEIPLYVKKYFPVGKNIMTYLTTGMGCLFMTKASGGATIHYTAPDSTASTGTMSLLGIRNRTTFEWLAGAGFGYKIRNLRLFIDARYYGGLTSFTNTDKGLKNSTLVNNYLYVDNAVKLRQFEIGASVSYTFINSVKRIRR